MEYLLEVDAFDPVANAIKTLRFGTVGISTTPGDSPANVFYDGCLVSAGDYSRNVFSDGTTQGAAQTGYGTIELTNADGRLDGLKDLAFDGRAFRLKSLSASTALVSTATILFAGTLNAIELTYKRVVFRLRDRLAILQKSIQATLFAGTTIQGGLTSNATLAEGRPEDLKGQPKPLLFGRARGVPAVLANLYDLIYVFSTGPCASIEAVYDRGVPLTKGSDYADLASLRAATLSAGSYGTCIAQSAFRTASTPAGTVTVDATEGTTLANRSAARIAQRILTTVGGLTSADLSTTSFDALHAAQPAECFVWTDTNVINALDVVAPLLAGIGGFLAPDRLGKFRVGRIAAPSGSPTVILTLNEILEVSNGQGVERVVTNDEGNGVPAWRTTVRWGRNYSVQTGTDIAQGNVTAPQKAFMAEEWRSAVAADATIQTVHPLAPDLSFDSMMTTEADAIAEAQRQLALRGVQRERYRVPVKSALISQVDLSGVLQLQFPRFGLSAGKLFLVIGLDEDYTKSITTLDLYG